MRQIWQWASTGPMTAVDAVAARCGSSHRDWLQKHGWDRPMQYCGGPPGRVSWRSSDQPPRVGAGLVVTFGATLVLAIVACFAVRPREDYSTAYTV